MDKIKIAIGFAILFGAGIGLLLGQMHEGGNEWVALAGFAIAIPTCVCTLFTVGTAHQERDDLKRTIALREAQYAKLLGIMLGHMDAIDERLGRMSKKQGAPGSITTTIRHQTFSIFGSWRNSIFHWISTESEHLCNEVLPNHQDMIRFVEGGRAYYMPLSWMLDGQKTYAASLKNVHEEVTGDLFRQIEALWRIKPPHAGVRDVRYKISSAAWSLAQFESGPAVSKLLGRVSAKALTWLVRQHPHGPHEERLKNHVLYGTLLDQDVDNEDTLEPEPPPAA